MRVLVTAIGSMSASVVINNLKQAGHIIIGCDINPRAWVHESSNTYRFYQAPGVADKEAYLQFIFQCCEHEKLDMILPLTDPEAELLSSHRSRLYSNVILAIPQQETVQMARDKMLWYQKFYNHDAIHPVPTCSLEHYRSDCWQYPLFMKPRDGRSSEAIQQINSRRELEMWQETLENRDYIVQPLLQGSVFVVDIVRHAQNQQCVSIAREE